MDQYDNKFHRMKFQSNAKEDIKENIPKLAQDINKEKISDDFSNEMAANYKMEKE